MLAYSVTGPPNANFTISIFINGANVPVAALKNASGSTPATVALGGSGFGSFVVFVPGSLLTNSLGTGYSAFYSFNATITSM